MNPSIVDGIRIHDRAAYSNMGAAESELYGLWSNKEAVWSVVEAVWYFL